MSYNYKYNRPALVLCAAILTSCNSGSGNSEVAVNCNTFTPDANYTVTMQTNWNASSFPAAFPGNPHFSPLAGVTHNNSVVFWKNGIKATTGIQLIAETGNRSNFNNEVNTAITAGNAQCGLSGGGASGVSSTELSFGLSRQYSLVSLISMIAPSPDWFIGIHDVDFYDSVNSKWLEKKAIALPIYDAGTDSGSTFSASNQATNPAENISLLTANATDFTNGKHRTTGAYVATFTFVLKP